VSSEAYEYPDAALHKLSERMRWSVGVIEEALAAEFSLGRGSERRQSMRSASHLQGDIFNTSAPPIQYTGQPAV
jgi:hypothetical protein